MSSTDNTRWFADMDNMCNVLACNTLHMLLLKSIQSVKTLSCGHYLEIGTPWVSKDLSLYFTLTLYLWKQN